MTSAASASSGSPCSASRSDRRGERKATLARPHPTATPTSTPTTTLPTRSQASQCRPHDETAAGRCEQHGGRDEGEREPVVEAGLGRQGEADVVLLVDGLAEGLAVVVAVVVGLARVAGAVDARTLHLDVAGEHRVGRGERGAEQQGRRGRDAETPAEQGHRRDRQGHRDGEQPPRRGPRGPGGAAAPVERAVDRETDAHERDEDRELGDPLDLRPDDDRVEAHPLGQRQQPDGHAEEQEHHRGRHGIPVEDGREDGCEEHRQTGDEVDQVDRHDDMRGLLLGVGLMMTYPRR